MSAPAAHLDPALVGRELPGDTVIITAYESAIADHALRASGSTVNAHPSWFLIIALRGMGISVEELCRIADQGPNDTLLFGTCEITQTTPLVVGSAYRTTATITETDRRTTRDGSILDSITVDVRLFDAGDSPAGSVVSVYLFKRGNRS